MIMTPAHFIRLVVLTVCLATGAAAKAAPVPEAKGKLIPEPLKAWETWATWGDEHRNCPQPYNDPKKRLCFWPSRLTLEVEKTGARLSLGVAVFSETWIPLPGGQDAWPMEVKLNSTTPVPVVEHEGVPSIRLPAGAHRLDGVYRWSDFPQKITVPREIGILALTLEGKPVETPAWDAQGQLWLKRDGSSEETDKDFLEVKSYAALEDGIPLWLRTEIELTVSGKSREEVIDTVLPEGWKAATVESQIPVAVDESGRLKSQVRAGKWTIKIDAFRFDNPKEFHYAANAKLAVGEQLVAFRSRPDFRMVEIVGTPSIDVSQTTFPDKWRELPVYRWDTAAPFRIEERMRGMGEQKPAGLTISRELWLGESGSDLTFRDAITGEMQQIWRLDAAVGQDLGSVRSAGQGQLITLNPQNGASGVEIRTRGINLEATGRMHRGRELPATGWRSDADSLGVTLNLPPGWRLFALFGADWVRGDWLSAWTLLDLFLLLIFTLAVFRLWGFFTAVLAFAAFLLSYREPDAPGIIWIILLIPIALLRVVPDGWGRKLLAIVKWITIFVFVITFVPFVVRQVQQALYPQLEIVSSRGGLLRARELPERGFQTMNQAEPQMEAPQVALPPNAPAEEYEAKERFVFKGKPSSKDNLLYDSKARIQTGPGVPEWKWRTVRFGWNGPVLASQQIRPILISQSFERVLTVVRIVLLLGLASVLLDARRLSAPIFRAGRKAAALFLFGVWLGAAPSSFAQFPEQTMLDALRQRLLETSDAFPTAADIPSVSLTLNERKITIDAEIHAATKSAVPLPGRLPTWAPVSVVVNDKPEAALRREDGYLWIVLPEGVHRVRIEGMLTNVTEWEWTFLLKPRQVHIDAPSWTFSGVKPDGAPEQQVFFVRKEKAGAGEASYDRQDLQTVAVIERNLELGLVWQVRSTVKRLSPVGKAIALRVPLLPGENVISSNAVVREGFIEVRLGAQEESFSWESGMAPTNNLKLATRAEDTWVERWYLVASPVWNVAVTGLLPTFEQGKSDLIPVWQPWPGEFADFAISRPEAVAGATMTVNRAVHEITLGKRQRTSKLDLSLRCSLGEDFLIDLPADAEITSLMHGDKSIPVRKDGTRVVVPLRPGEQAVSLNWKTNSPLLYQTRSEPVKLAVESANVTTVLNVPDSQWVLWADGPRRGPAVRFWVVLVCSLIAAIVLSRVGVSPLRAIEWMLLVIGLTQVPLVAALIVVGWLFLLAWRGQDSFLRLKPGTHNTLQVFIIGVTAVALGILIFAVGAGLLGNPEMFIAGNGSTRSALRWYQARSEAFLPSVGCVSVSIWWYRLLMLAWALWLAAALIRWLRLGWKNFSSGGLFKSGVRAPATPPPLSTAH
jgi:hypothetical protein